MPRVDIWIRKEDWDKWEAIENKPEFIHNAILAGDVGKVLYPFPKGKDLAIELSKLDIDDGVSEITLSPPEDTA